jgi:hypothetical protein
MEELRKNALDVKLLIKTKPIQFIIWRKTLILFYSIYLYKLDLDQKIPNLKSK